MFRLWKLMIRKTTTAIMSSAILAAIITCITPTLVVLEISKRHSLPSETTISWLFGGFVIAGFMGFLLAWQTRQPINATMSVPAAVFIGYSLQYIPVESAIFGYAMSGVMITFISILGIYEKIISYINPRIVVAMFVGAIIHYTVNIIGHISNHIWIGSIAVITYLLTMRYFKLFPPVVMSIIIVTLGLGFSGLLPLDKIVQVNWTAPVFYEWEPSWLVIFSISIPLVLIVLSAEVTIGGTLLKSEGYNPSVNKMTLFTGVATITGSFFGSHNVTSSGVPVGVLSDPMTGKKNRRFLAALWASFFTLLFGLFANFVYNFLSSYPEDVLQMIVGLVLVSIVLKGLNSAFGGQELHYGAFTAFIVAMSNITIFEIGAPFWAVVFGIVVSSMVDKRYRNQSVTNNGA